MHNKEQTNNTMWITNKQRSTNNRVNCIEKNKEYSGININNCCSALHDLKIEDDYVVDDNKVGHDVALAEVKTNQEKKNEATYNVENIETKLLTQAINVQMHLDINQDNQSVVSSSSHEFLTSEENKFYEVMLMYMQMKLDQHDGPIHREYEHNEDGIDKTDKKLCAVTQEGAGETDDKSKKDCNEMLSKKHVIRVIQK